MLPPYNMAFACLECRKSFKREFDLSQEHSEKMKCPDCGGEAYNFGRHFKVPKKADKKQWEKVERLFLAVFRFFGSGSHGGPKLPEKLCDVERFIKENQNHPLRVAEPIHIN